MDKRYPLTTTASFLAVFLTAGLWVGGRWLLEMLLLVLNLAILILTIAWVHCQIGAHARVGSRAPAHKRSERRPVLLELQRIGPHTNPGEKARDEAREREERGLGDGGGQDGGESS